MNNVVELLEGKTIGIQQLSEGVGAAVANPFLFLLISFIVVDIVSGLGATFTNRKGLDSSIAFKGWVKHTTILTVSFVIQFASTVLGFSFVGDLVTLLGVTVYFSSIPGNFAAMGLDLPEPIMKAFKAEIERKLHIYNGKEDEKDE